MFTIIRESIEKELNNWYSTDNYTLYKGYKGSETRRDIKRIIIICSSLLKINCQLVLCQFFFSGSWMINYHEQLNNNNSDMYICERSIYSNLGIFSKLIHCKTYDSFDMIRKIVGCIPTDISNPFDFRALHGDSRISTKLLTSSITLSTLILKKTEFNLANTKVNIQFIYIRHNQDENSIDRIHERIRNRDRTGEDGITKEYLKTIGKEHDNIFLDKSNTIMKVCTIQSDKVQFLARECMDINK